MANLISTNVEENEIVKADDLNNGYNASITNITNTLKAIFEHRQDFVVGGEISAYSGMGISIKPVFGICTNDENGDPAADVVMESEEKINAATVSQGYSVDRIDTVEIRGNLVGTTQQQRAFIDFETNTQTLQNVMTKNELQLEIRIKKNADDGVYHSAAPEKDDGWIKIAEIFVPANCNDIDLCTINNISADVYDMENTEWTNEKKVTYNIGRISDINERFRVGHNKDGSHKAGVIGKNEINRTGTDSNKVTSGDFQLGGSVTASSTTKSSTDSILAALQMLASKITDLYTPYLSNGAFKFKAGEIVISKSAAYDAATAVKIGANGDGTAYLKIGDNKVFDITAAGQIRMKSGYSAGNALDVVTKSVTDSLATRITTAETNITNLNTAVENNKIFANETLSRLVYKGYTRVATTANITLSGLQTIDGVTLAAGDSVLVKDQSDAKQNGIYSVQTGAWNRYSGYTAGSEANIKNKIFYASTGTSNAGKAFYVALETFTIGTTALPFKEANFSISKVGGKLVMRDKDGNFSAGTITASLNGSACNALCLGSSPAANYAKCSGAVFASSTFGAALGVKRTGSTNGAAIEFSDCTGVTGYLAKLRSFDRFVRYNAAHDTCYTILDTSTAVTVAQGGTGATTAAAARTCLGLGTAAVCAATAFLGATANAASATYATYIRVTETKCATAMHLLFTAGSAADTNYYPRTFGSGIRYISNADATTAVASELVLGNTTATGTSGNRFGSLTLYGTGAYYVNIRAQTATANRIICLPDKAGTFALTTDITLNNASCLNSYQCTTSSTPAAQAHAYKIFGLARSYTNCTSTTSADSADRRTYWQMGVVQCTNACAGYTYLDTCVWECKCTGTTCTSRRFTFNSNGCFVAPVGVQSAIIHAYSTTFGSLQVTRSGSANPAAIKFNNCNGNLGYLAALGTANCRFVRYKTDGSTYYTILDTSAAVTIAQGGTGATTAATARTCLGALGATEKAVDSAKADTLKMTKFTASADRPVLITCPVTWPSSGSTGYPDGNTQGISTSCPLTFNPATGVLKAKTFCGALSGTATYANNVNVTTKAIGSVSSGLPLLFGSAESGNVTVYGSCSGVRYLSDATSSRLMLGLNSCPGALGLYTTGGSYAMLKAASSTACHEITLPAKTGTVALTCDLGTAAACAATCFVPNLPFAVIGHYLGTCTTTGNKLIPVDSLPSGDTYGTGYCITCYNACKVKACSFAGGDCYFGCVCLKNNTSTRIRYLVKGFCALCCKYYCCYGYLQPGCCTGSLPGYYKCQTCMSLTCVDCPAIIKWYSSSSISSIKMSTNPKGLGFIYNTGGGPAESEIFFNE